MNAVLYNWLGVAAASPFVAILSCWTLVVFRSYRREWLLLDLFLFALTSLEVTSSLFAFGFAVLNVIRPSLDGPCGFIVWGLVATRTFHLSAVTSLLLDRALSSRWPYTYRSSVRQSQVQYHIVVLAIISTFVGVTAVFARQPHPAPYSTCSLHPSSWDLKFAAFLASVFALLLTVGFASCLVVQMGRMRGAGSYRTAATVLPHSGGWESAGTNSSAGGGSGTKLDGGDFSECKDLEWTVVACVCWLSYMVNHGPYLVLTAMGVAVPTFWSAWLDVAVVWLRLVQGALVPLLLLAADLPHRSALRNMLRQPGRIYRHLSDHGGFQLQIGDQKSIAKPNQLPPSVMMFPGAYHQQNRFQLPQRLRWSPTTLPSLQSLQPTDHLSKLQDPGGHLDSASTRKSDYSTFGDVPTFSSMSTSGLSDNSGSITMDAVDDFVFHGTRGCRSPHPSVLTIFRQTPEDKPITIVRKDTPTPFLDETTNYCSSTCDCDMKQHQQQDILLSSRTGSYTVQKNMIDIIMAYQHTTGFSPKKRSYERSLDMSLEASYERCLDRSYERSFEKDSLDMGETTSSSSEEGAEDFLDCSEESSESEDSVKSVILRRANSDLSSDDGHHHCSTGDDVLSNCDSALSEKLYEQRVIYSEYL